MILTFDGTTGRLKAIFSEGVLASVDQQFMWWNASDGNNINSNQVRDHVMYQVMSRDKVE